MSLGNKFKMKLNVKEASNKFIPVVTANDTTIFEFEVYDGPEKIELLETYEFKFVTKPRGKGSVLYDAELNEDGNVVVELTFADVDHGNTECSLLILDEDKRVTTMRMMVDVKGDLALQGELPSESRRLIIADEAQLIKAVSVADEVEEARGNEANIGARFDSVMSHLAEIGTEVVAKANKTEVESLALQIDQLVIEGDSSVEAAQARVGSGNITYPTLKQRLDSEHTAVVQPLTETLTKVTLTNLLKNSNFNNGLTDWEVLRATGTISSNILTVKGDGSGANFAIRQVLNSAIAGHIYYVRANVTTKTSGILNSIRIEFQPAENGVLSIAQQVNEGILNQIYALSGNVVASSNEDIQFIIRKTLVDAATAANKEMTINKLVMIDLTETFGDGYEPTSAQMDSILVEKSESWFEGNLDLFSHSKKMNSIEVKGEPSTVVVAAHNSKPKDKALAHFVCDGVNDEFELNKAMEVFNFSSGKIRLCDGDYYIDSLYDTGVASVGKFALPIKHPNTQREIEIEGTSAPIRKRGSIMALTGGPVIHVRRALYDSLTNTEKVTVIGGLPSNLTTGEYNYPSISLKAKNIGIVLPDNKKSIIGIDGQFLTTMKVDTYVASLDLPLSSFTVGNINCIGLRGLQGKNYGAGYRLDNCFIYGMGVCYDLSGEHLIANNLGCRFSLYSYRFNFYGTNQRPPESSNCHPNTLINCCHEQCLNGPYFAKNNISGQSWNFIDYNIEYEEENGWLQTTFAKEEVPGSFRGMVTYQYGDEDYINDQSIPFWEEGSGTGFKTVNLTHKVAGLSNEKPTRAANLGQTYFDNTLGKPLFLKALAVREIDTLTVTGGATASGNITISLNNVAKTVAVSAGDTAEVVANKIRAASFYRWSQSGTGTSVVFKNSAGGAIGAPTFNGGSTGVTATFAVTRAGVGAVWVDGAGTTV